MVVVLQLFGAGGLLLAWLWLLSRPALTSDAFDSAVDGDEGPGDVDFWGHESLWRRSTAKAGVAIARWWNPTVEGRRRQLTLATLIAAFVSFFLAIALKGRFVHLFGTMLALLVAHLSFATRLGGRIVEERRTRLALAAQRRERSTGRRDDIQLGRTGVVTLLGPEDEAEMVGVTSYVSDLINEAWEDVERVATPADATAPAAVVAMSVDDLASQLEWADDTAPVAEAAATTAEPATHETRREVAGEAETATTKASKSKSKSKARKAKAKKKARDKRTGAAEPIFTRAAKDTPSSARSRRKPQPIHIESALDDDTDLGPAPQKAVNQS